MASQQPHHRAVPLRRRAVARIMRRRPTEAERKLWFLMRDRRLDGWKFRRQVPVGSYVVDFACFEARLIVEADGGQHAESRSDTVRDAWLCVQGFTVVRYWNNDILGNPDGVLEDLWARLSETK